MLNINKTNFGKLPNGRQVTQFTLTNANDISIAILDFGGIITQINTPDKAGNFDNIVLGYDNITSYWFDQSMMGALVGPYANRISNANFSIDNKNYYLDKNFIDKHNIHAGSAGINNKIWNSKTSIDENNARLTLEYTSPNGLGGYPANIDIKVSYILDNANKFHVEYSAIADATTALNLTQHSYFNLNGVKKSNILDHHLNIDSNKFLEVDEEQIPTGQFLNIENSPFDFSKSKPIGRDIHNDDEQLKIGNGYDICYILKNPNIKNLSASLYAPNTGRIMNVYTDRPAIQVYTSNSLENPFADGKASIFKKFDAVCLETEGYINAINQKTFPSDILKANHKFNSLTIFEFCVG